MSNEWTVTIQQPVTREQIEAVVRGRAADPDTVVEVVHLGFNADPGCGGFAFVSDRELLIISFDGGYGHRRDRRP
jgi:hypothetical protein